MPVLNRIADFAPEMTAWRRHLHQHPELSFDCHETAAFVAARLHDFGVDEIHEGIARTGIVAIIEGQTSDRCFALRADTDALPILEEGKPGYCSTVPGVMHACGHDAHTAIGMGLAQLMSQHRDEIAGTLKFVFQPAEEGENGALAMISDGVLNDPAPEIALGLHVWNEAPVGIAQVGAGGVMAAADIFTIKVQGKGTHGAQPHRGVDAILLSAQIVNALQTVVARNVDPRQTAVVTVGTLHAGTAFNIIADSAEMTGTIRTFEPSVREQILQRVKDVVEGTASALGGSAVIEIKAISPATINDERVAKLVRATAMDVMGAANVSTDQFTMGAEDMSEFLNRVPGCFFFLGSANTDHGPVYPHHNPRFDIDESILPDGVAILAGAVLRYLNGEG